MKRTAEIIALICLIIVVIISLVFLGFLIAVNTKQQASPKQQDTSQISSCPHYGTLTKDTYLSTYTVQPGDTLLSIANKQLGDSSRASEIGKLNEDISPQLSLQNPFLEVGWKLHLPVKDFPMTSGNLLGVQGKIKASQTDVYQLEISSGGGTFYLYPNVHTTFLEDKSAFAVGTCAFAVVDEKNSNALIEIGLQDK